MATNLKRHRAPSQTSSSSSSTTSPGKGLNPSKASRILPGHSESGVTSDHPILCTLPPTCTHQPTPLAGTRDLETHYATYHAHVCEQGGCGTVFPDARLLELHQTECHDPVAALRREKGEKTFACHLSSCARLFSTPKGRRLHLIQAHGYPKEYFFAVTNKGVGGLLKRWGEGVSMIRGQWKPRRGSVGENGEGGTESDGEAIEVDPVDDTGEPRSELRMANEHGDVVDGDASLSNKDDGMDSLADTLSSLSLVPSSIRFGRGGKKGGFLKSSEREYTPGDGRNTGARGRGRGKGRGTG